MSESKDICVTDIEKLISETPGLRALLDCPLQENIPEEDKDSESGSESDEDYDVCEGCHWCDPKSYPEKPPVIPLPEGHIISIHCLVHKEDEGIITDWDNWFKMFGSYESASKAILDFYKKGGKHDNYYPENYKKPSFEWACKRYNPNAISEWDSVEYIRLYGEDEDNVKIKDEVEYYFTTTFLYFNILEPI